MTLQDQFARAVEYHQRGLLAEAERLYREILRAAPRAFEPRHMLGVVRAQQGRNDEALALIGEALQARPGDPQALTNYGNVLAAMGRFGEAVDSHDRALAAQPAHADALNNRGNALRGLGRMPEALDSYDRALAAQPGHLEALNNRGNALQELGRFSEALESLDRVVALAPSHAEALYNRGNALQALSRYPEALDSYDRATALMPSGGEGHVGVLNNRGQCLQAMRRFEDALDSFDRAIAAAPDAAEAQVGKSLCLLLTGRLEDGFRLYEGRKRMGVEARDYPQPLWSGAESLTGKILFLYIEQGLGDTIQFYRYVALAQERGARVILSAQDVLHPLLRSALPAVELIGYGAVPARFDYHAPLMSLPLAFGTTLATIPAAIPYLRAEPDRIARWKAHIGDGGLRIGIGWEGNRQAVGGAGRAFPLAALASIARLPGIRLISLQKGVAVEKLDLPSGMTVESLGPEFDATGAFLDSAAAMHGLDLVITMDATLAHLAGALGRPAWVALKQVPDWRWLLDREDSPWYPGLRLFRQEQDGDWQAPFAAMERQLVKML